jgi:signal transduction histidine kinase
LFIALEAIQSRCVHELRGPHAALAANVEMGLLENDGLRFQQQRRFEAIGAETSQMKHLVNDFLMLARQDEQRIEHVQPVDVSELLQQQVDLNRDSI